MFFILLGLVEYSHAGPSLDLRFVSPPSISPRLGDPSRYERLVVAERNTVLHSVNLDRSPEHWAHHLLRISVGFHEEWTPANFYALFPQGYKAKEKIASAAIDTLMVEFPKTYQPDGPLLHSVNRLGYTLTQQGEYLVVGYLDRERWYFESPDGGTRWRLAKLGWAKHPGRFTTLEYTNGQITALHFPNGQEAKITYDGNSLPNRIDTPWGETTLIERQAGLVTKITTYRQLPNGALSKPIKTFQYEYGGDRKVKRFVNSFGIPFDVSCTERQTQDRGVDCVVYEATIRNAVDGSFSLHRHISDTKGRWRFETLWGTAKDTPETAQLESMVTYQNLNKRWSEVAQAKGSEKREVNYELDKSSGSPKAVVDAEGRTRLVDYNKQGKATRQVTPDGKVTQTKYNEYGQRTQEVDSQGRNRVWEYDEATRLIRYVDEQGQLTTYEYDDRGYCNEAVVNGKAWRYHFDDWGRLTWAQDAQGNMTRWTFDPCGQLTEEARFKPSPAAAKPVEAIAEDGAGTPEETQDKPRPLAEAESWTQYAYDELGRLTGIERSNGDKEQFQYEPRPNGRLAAHIRADGIRVTYVYDALRMLHEIRDPTKGVFQYWYYPSGALRISRTEEKGKSPVTYRYNHVGELLSKTVVGEGQTQYVYDKAGVLVQKIGPDGKPIEQQK